MIYWWLIVLFLKFFIVSISPLTTDENYYWVWSQKLQLSYFDHPPFVAWLFKCGSYLPDFMLKWPSVLMGHASFLIWLSFLANLGFSKNQKKNLFLFAIFSPLVGLSSMVVTPDLPLLFFFSLAIFSFERALNQKNIIYYLLFGLSLGLGFTSKYHIVLVIPCILIYLSLTQQWNQIRYKAIPLVLLMGLIGSFPVLWWNYQNEWASFKFQLYHGMGKKSWKPIWPVEYLISVIILILPFNLKTFWIGIRAKELKLLLALSIPIILFFLLSSFRSKVEANWTQLAFFPILSIIAYYEKGLLRPKLTLGIWSFLLIVLLVFFKSDWFPSCPEKLCEPLRYKSLISISENYSPFYASNYQMASYLWFNKRKPVYKLFDMSRTDFFDTMAEGKANGSEFYIAKDLETELPEWVKQKGYNFQIIQIIDKNLILLKVSR